VNRIQLDTDRVRRLPMTHSTLIPDEYMDAMGHMNVMWYTHLFSVAMGGTLHLLGLNWKEMAENHIGTFALESHIRYLSEVCVGQTVEIHSRLLGRTTKRFHAIHFMTNLARNDVSATFEVVGAYIDLKVRRMAPMPEEWTRELDRLISEHNQLDWDATTCGVMAP